MKKLSGEVVIATELYYKILRFVEKSINMEELSGEIVSATDGEHRKSLSTCFLLL